MIRAGSLAEWGDPLELPPIDRMIECEKADHEASDLLIFRISEANFSQGLGIMSKVLPNPSRDARREMGIEPNHAAITG